MEQIYLIQILFFILISILSFVQDQDLWLEYLEGKGFEINESIYEKKTKRYAIKFVSEKSTDYKGPNYLKIEVTVDSGIAPLLCFSHNDPSCESRDILVRNQNGKSVYFWVKKEQYEDQNDKPYFTVTCAGNEKSCSYKIKGSESEGSFAEFYPDFAYSYLVTNKNKEMNFKLSNVPDNKTLTICVDGSYKAKLNIKENKNVVEYGSIRCSNIDTFNKTDYFVIFTIEAEEGDYLTLSAHTVTKDVDSKGLANEDFALPNGPIISGYIHNETSFECFPLNQNILDKASKYLYIEGKIHNKYALFFLRDKNGEYITDT